MTYTECVAKANKLRISPSIVTHAFGINRPKTREEIELIKRLKKATDQCERWRVVRVAEKESKIEENALMAVLDNSTTQEELLKVLEYTGSYKVQRAAALAYLDNAASLKERWYLYNRIPLKSPINHVVLQAIENACKAELATANTRRKLWQLYKLTPRGEVLNAIVRALCQ